MLWFHVISTWLLVGLIWLIQLFVYPQFLRVQEAEFVMHHFAHCLRVGIVIVPLILIEAVTAVYLLCVGHREWSFLISVALILVTWLSTVVVQAPMHVKLMRGFDAEIIRRLILSNWVRTLAWTARGVLVGWMVVS